MEVRPSVEACERIGYVLLEVVENRHEASVATNGIGIGGTGVRLLATNLLVRFSIGFLAVSVTICGFLAPRDSA